MLPLKVAGVGVYVPERCETREDFIRRGVPNELIEKMGVYERRIVADGQTAADLEVEAARRALNNASMDPSEIDLILSATLLPEMVGIPNSNLLQHRLGAKKAAALDINQACGSVIPGMVIAANFLALGQYRRILLTVSTHWSVISDADNPISDFVLGDGAAAMVLTNSSPEFGISSFEMQTDGGYFFDCGIRVGHDHTIRYYNRHGEKLLFYIDNNGVEGTPSHFSSFLSEALPANFHAALKKAALLPNDIDCAVIHANVKPLVDRWLPAMQIPAERVPMTYDLYGNVGAATIVLNIHEGIKRGLIKRGDTVALVSQGAGFSNGTIIMRWE